MGCMREKYRVNQKYQDKQTFLKCRSSGPDYSAKKSLADVSGHIDLGIRSFYRISNFTTPTH